MRFLALLVMLFATRAAAADLALVGATLFPNPEAEPVRDAVVWVKDGRIAAIGARDQVTLPEGVEVIDYTGKFITAGFWNSHVHIFTPDLLHARDTPVEQLDASLEAIFTRWGFTTVFDVASDVDNTLALRDRIERGEVSGPRILTVGQPFWVKTPIYVVDYLHAHGIEIPPVTTPEEATARVASLAGRGVNGIKLFTGSVQGRGAVANMDVELVRAATAEAHRRKLPVFSHPQNTEGLEAAVEGGVDVLAHTAPQSPAWTPEFVARLNEARVALIPTLTLFRVEGERGELPPEILQRWIEHALSQVRAFHEGGGDLLFGTDVGYIDQFDTAEEFELLARAGLDFRAMLTSLTTAPAGRFGDAVHTGRIEPGSAADLVVLDDDPREDVTALARVRATVRGGKFIYRAR
ncbi:MAG: amidohydrolase family protein [Opitutus sp.]|nr:amidohydrolase family protein [Opitutus sp.]